MGLKLAEGIESKRGNSIKINPAHLKFSNFTGRKQGLNEESVEKLVDSILASGQLQPIGIRKNWENEPIVIFGHHRAEAIKRINERGLAPEDMLVDCVFFNVNEEEAAILTIQENNDDTRTPISCIDMAFLIRELETRFGYTQQQIADKLGKQQTQVSQYRKLLTLDEKMQNKIVQDNINFSAALALVNVAPDEREAVLDLSKEGSKKVTATKVAKVARESGARVKTSVKRTMAEFRVFLSDLAESSKDNHVQQTASGILEYLNGEMSDKQLVKLLKK